MKVADIEIGVEYAYTGPLAYGNEPHVARPAKIRFVDLTPGWGWGRVMVANAPEEPRSRVNGAKIRQRQSWRHARSEIVNPNKAKYVEWRDLPISTHGFPLLKEGTERMIFAPERGHFLAERWNGHAQKWEVALYRPAGVHRTWAEHEENERKSAERTRQRNIDEAPYRYKTALRDLVKNARLAGFDEAQVLADIHTAMKETQS